MNLTNYLLQEQENESSEKKTTFWRNTSGSEVLTGQAQKSESEKKIHQKSLISSTQAMGEENGDLSVDTTNEELNRLREKENRLVNEIQELREQNELLEFRLLELEYYNMNSTNRVSLTLIIDCSQLTSTYGGNF